MPQAFNGAFKADEVDLKPVHAVLGFHHFGDVVDGAVALDQVEVGLVGTGDALHRTIAGEDGDHFIADLPEDAFLFPAVAADVVFAKNVDGVLGGRFVAAGADDFFHQAVVGDMVAGGLAHAFIAFTAVGHAADAVFLFRFGGYGLDVVADEAHGAGGGNHDGLGVHKLHDFINGFLELLGAAEDDVRLLQVGSEAVLDEVGVVPFGLGFVATGAPAVEAAAHGAVGDENHILDGAQHHAFAARVTAAAVGHDAGNGAGVGDDLLFRRGINPEHMLLAVFENFGVVALQHYGVGVHCHTRYLPYASVRSPVRTT